MTSTQRRAIGISVTTTLLGAALLSFGTWASGSMVFRPEFTAAMEATNAKLDALLTLQCRATPLDTICRAYR